VTGFRESGNALARNHIVGGDWICECGK